MEQEVDWSLRLLTLFTDDYYEIKIFVRYEVFEWIFEFLFYIMNFKHKLYYLLRETLFPCFFDLEHIFTDVRITSPIQTGHNWTYIWKCLIFRKFWQKISFKNKNFMNNKLKIFTEKWERVSSLSQTSCFR